MDSMKKIASHDEIDIFAPDDSKFSFLKSPYAAHKSFSAVDIYYGNFGSDALSPVNGEIIDTQCFNTPTPFKDRDSKEYVIAIRQRGYVIKILHVKPEISIGEKISKGERIGTFIKNGYFIFWNDPAMHVEVRKQGNYLRAANNLRLTPSIKWSRLPLSMTLELECGVKEVNKRYTLLCSSYQKCGDISGFAIDGGFLDGYIASNSEDDFFGVIKPQGYFHPEVSALEIAAGGSEITCAGIAFSLSFNEPMIKVIPLKYGDALFSMDDIVSIKLEVKR